MRFRGSNPISSRPRRDVEISCASPLSASSSAAALRARAARVLGTGSRDRSWNTLITLNPLRACTMKSARPLVMGTTGRVVSYILVPGAEIIFSTASGSRARGHAVSSAAGSVLLRKAVVLRTRPAPKRPLPHITARNTVFTKARAFPFQLRNIAVASRMPRHCSRVRTWTTFPSPKIFIMLPMLVPKLVSPVRTDTGSDDQSTHRTRASITTYTQLPPLRTMAFRVSEFLMMPLIDS